MSNDVNIFHALLPFLEGIWLHIWRKECEGSDFIGGYHKSPSTEAIVFLHSLREISIWFCFLVFLFCHFCGKVIVDLGGIDNKRKAQLSGFVVSNEDGRARRMSRRYETSQQHGSGRGHSRHKVTVKVCMLDDSVVKFEIEV